VSSTIANWFTQDNALMASNNGALVLQRVAKKLKYSARCTGLGAGSRSSLLMGLLLEEGATKQVLCPHVSLLQEASPMHHNQLSNCTDLHAVGLPAVSPSSLPPMSTVSSEAESFMRMQNV